MEQYIPLLVSALGGTVLGPVIARLAGGSGTGGVLGGILGGVAAHFIARQAGIEEVFGSTALMIHLQDFVEGGIGGGILAAIAGVLLKKRA